MKPMKTTKKKNLTQKETNASIHDYFKTRNASVDKVSDAKQYYVEALKEKLKSKNFQFNFGFQ